MAVSTSSMLTVSCVIEVVIISIADMSIKGTPCVTFSAEKFSFDGSCGNGVSEGAEGSTDAGEGLPTVSASFKSLIFVERLLSV